MDELRKYLTVWFFVWLGLGWTVSLTLTDKMIEYRNEAICEISSHLDADDREKVESFMTDDDEGEIESIALYDGEFILLSAVIGLFALNTYNRFISKKIDGKSYTHLLAIGRPILPHPATVLILRGDQGHPHRLPAPSGTGDSPRSS